MNQYLINRTVGIIATAVAILAQTSAMATVIDLRAAQEAEASLISRWDFEGADLSAALEDRTASDKDLVHRTGWSDAIPPATVDYPLTLVPVVVEKFGSTQGLQVTRDPDGTGALTAGFADVYPTVTAPYRC